MIFTESDVSFFQECSKLCELSLMVDIIILGVLDAFETGYILLFSIATGELNFCFHSPSCNQYI